MITQSPDEVREQNRELVRRYYTLAFVEHDLKAASSLMAPDYMLHDPNIESGQLSGVDAWKGLQGSYFKMIPDHQLTILDQIAENDKVVTRWCAKGTEGGDHFDVTGITITRVQDGQIAEEWQDWDSEGLYRQLGQTPDRRKTA
jgi:predicted SnoaL-like aldol condensation-catalyzing enzyme